MNIAICDDEVEETGNISVLIKEYAQNKNYDIHCRQFNKGSELLNAPKFDLYILDYKMDEMNGVEVAETLKEKFSGNITICYLTNYESAAEEVINHHIYADGFLRKPVDTAKLYEKLDRFYLTSFTNRLLLKKNTELHTVYTGDISYIEADGKRSIFYLINGVQDFNYLLSDMERMLEQNGSFIRVHRSFIVNMAYVASFNSKTVTLRDGTQLPLKNKNFRSVYRDFLFESKT